MQEYIIQLEKTWPALLVDKVVEKCKKKGFIIHRIDWDGCVLYVSTDDIKSIKHMNLGKTAKLFQQIKF